MPIIIKDYKWKETQKTVTITVPLRGIHQSKADIFYCKQFLKATFEQFYFEVFLLHPIDPSQSTCTLTSGDIVFELVKCEPILWNGLEQHVEKSEKLALKTAYIEEELERQRKDNEEKNSRKSELKRLAVREQLAIDADQRKKLETIKENEKKNALNNMNLLKEKRKLPGKSKQKDFKKEILRNEDIIVIPPPPIRQSQVINVEFTPREFPTPCRESRMEEENEWLRKQVEARRSAGFISEDIRPEERNPQFLKAKGDEFFKNKNYLGAISAYTFGIKINNKFADLYIARSEAHFLIGNYTKTAEDCSKALELMKPEVSLNLQERAVCIGRRGLALINLGLLPQGISELTASLKLAPNEEFKKKLEEAEDKLDEQSD